MNEEIKAEWLKRLRSTNYKQAQGAYRKGPNCFCPLGLLADIIDPTGWKYYPLSGNYFLTTKLEDILEKARIKSDQAQRISLWNDCRLLTFKQIAKKIERLL